MQLARVAIIILNWNGKRMLLDCLSSLGLTDYPDSRIIVVDNGSTDGSPDSVSSRFPGVDLIRLPRNLGYQGGFNAGVRRAMEAHDADYFVLLNNDTLFFQKHWLTHMVRVADSDPSIGLVNCRYMLQNGTPQTTGLMLIPGVYLDSILKLPFRFTNMKEQSDYIHETPTAGGPCFLVKRKVVDAIGLLDEGFSPVYFEDIDYSLRARRAGFRLVHDGYVSVIHFSMASTKKLPSTYVSFIYRKNLMRYLRIYHPRAVPFVAGLLLMSSPFRAAQTAGRAAGRIEYLRNDFRATVRAVQLGLRG